MRKLVEGRIDKSDLQWATPFDTSTTFFSLSFFGKKMVRIKNRYLLYELKYAPETQDVKTKVSLNSGAVFAAIKESIANLYGDFGIGLVQKGLQSI